MDELVAPVYRVRAIEILTELFNGLPLAEADIMARSPSPLVRARVAWSLGRIPGTNPSLVLFRLLGDGDPLVRRCALEAVADHVDALASPELVGLLLPSLGHADKRVRLAAARVASRLSEAAWNDLSTRVSEMDSGTRLTTQMAQMWRVPQGNHPETLSPLATILDEANAPLLRLDAIRLIILALGDWNLHQPTREIYTGYEAAALPANQTETLNHIRALARRQLPSDNAALNDEAARLLAMLEDDDARSARAIVGMITPQSSATSDFHFLVCFSRLRVWPANLTHRVASAILNLDPKLGRLDLRPQQNWPVRLRELVDVLVQREPKLADALLANPGFATPGHLGLGTELGLQHQDAVAKLYLAAVRKNPDFPWTGPLVDLLSLLPASEVRPLFRQQCRNPLLRDELLMRLTAEPEAADCNAYWQGLSSSRMDVVRACVNALLALPRTDLQTNLVAPFALLRRLLDDPDETALRRDVLMLMATETGQHFQVQEPAVPAPAALTYAAAIKVAYRPPFAWLAKNHPQVWRQISTKPEDDAGQWLTTLKTVPWAQGNPARGERLFLERCAICHASERSLGPDLAGVTTRFSVQDLFYAIIYPSREIAAPYRQTAFQMRNGQVVNGFVASQFPAGVIVQTTPTATERLPNSEILSRQPSPVSFMPKGLLNGLKPGDLADLYRFLKSLPPK